MRTVILNKEDIYKGYLILINKEHYIRDNNFFIKGNDVFGKVNSLVNKTNCFSVKGNDGSNKVNDFISKMNNFSSKSNDFSSKVNGLVSKENDFISMENGFSSKGVGSSSRKNSFSGRYNSFSYGHSDFSHTGKLIPVDAQYKDVLLESKTLASLLHLLKLIGCSNEIVPVSGYRSRNEQEQIYNQSLLENGTVFTERYVALPDRSEHQTGLAIDLARNANEIDFIRPDFPYTGIYGTFRKNAVKYGFIERYQKDKESITGISYEPWHFRYVGYPHSQIMQDNNLSLEEYILFIKDYLYGEKHFRIQEMSREIEVSYIPVGFDTTTVEVPENNCFQISGNNVDGFVITIWS
jgi:D-alanyl-D-alanine dipeptidase/carboxypeptidase